MAQLGHISKNGAKTEIFGDFCPKTIEKTPKKPVFYTAKTALLQNMQKGIPEFGKNPAFTPRFSKRAEKTRFLQRKTAKTPVFTPDFSVGTPRIRESDPKKQGLKKGAAVPGEIFSGEKVKNDLKNAKKKTAFYRGKNGLGIGAFSEKGGFSALPGVYTAFIPEKRALLRQKGLFFTRKNPNEKNTRKRGTLRVGLEFGGYKPPYKSRVFRKSPKKRP